MKAITLWQPWASLCVIPRPGDCDFEEEWCHTHQQVGARCPRPLPFKTIETRSWPAPKSLIGQRIAIHAAKREPERHEWALPYPPWTMWVDEAGDRWLQHYTFIDRNMIDTYQEWAMPLGAVVGTAVLADCVPMVSPSDRYTSTHLTVSRDKDGGPHLFLWKFDGVGPDAELLDCEPVHDQAPFGHFEPGRWAWLLTDAERFAEPIPAAGQQGLWNWETPS